MSFFKIKTALMGLLTVSVASTLFAVAVVDATFEDNQNDFEYYWYYYDDNAGVGDNDRPQADPTGTPSVINVPYTEKDRAAFGVTSDNWQVKQYTFTTLPATDPGAFSKPCATVPFTFGDEWEASYGTATPYIGIGTMLTKEGEGIDLTGVETIKFSIKSRVNPLSVTVKLQTLEIDEYSQKPNEELEGDEFGYYGITFTVDPGDWQEQEFAIDDLKLPGTWAKKIDFNILKCTKLAWEVAYDEAVTSDTLDIADVSFGGTYEFVSPSMWTKTEVSPPADGVFATFDKTPYNQSPLGTYWYAYNDVEIQGTSAVSEAFATQNAETGRLNIKFQDGTGSDGAGKGAALEYTLGAPIPRDSITILGFVGIGCNLYDSAASTYWDAPTEGSDGTVYFEYLTDAGAKYLTLEVSDMNDVGDATTPDRKDTRGSGIVYYRNFPATGGTWQRVRIPLDSLVTHDTWEGYNHIPLDKTKLAKIQWKIQGAKDLNGLYAIDNVCFPGVTAFEGTIAVDKKFEGAAKPASAFNAVYNNGAVRVNWNGTSKLVKGKVSLINTRGAVVASAPVASGLTTSMLSAGMYFVTINGLDAAGKTVTARSVVNVVK